MTNSIELPASTFKALCSALGYKRKMVRVEARERVMLQDLNWSGGTRNQYHAFNIGTGDIASATFLNTPAPWDPRNAEGKDVPLAPGLALVRTGTFCGKPAMMTISVHPSNMPALIGAQ